MKVRNLASGLAMSSALADSDRAFQSLIAVYSSPFSKAAWILILITVSLVLGSDNRRANIADWAWLHKLSVFDHFSNCSYGIWAYTLSFPSASTLYIVQFLPFEDSLLDFFFDKETSTCQRVNRIIGDSCFLILSITFSPILVNYYELHRFRFISLFFHFCYSHQIPRFRHIPSCSKGKALFEKVFKLEF